MVRSTSCRVARVSDAPHFSRACSATLAHFRRRFLALYGRPYEFDACRDAESLIDIAHAQACGSVPRACRIVDEMFDAAGGALFGETLERRFISLLAWYGHGRPKKPRPVSSHELRNCRVAIADNAMAAARRERERRARQAGKADVHGLVFFCALFGAIFGGPFTAAALVVLALVTGAVARRWGLA